MKRIVILGSSGAGKSTLAAELGACLRLPVVHLDRLFWNPGWVETANEEWDQIVRELCGKPEWIIDGNYSRTLKIRLGAADTVVFLDFPRWRCLWRIVRRWWQYRGASRPDMAPGCPEQLTWEFLLWVWNFPRQSRPGVLRLLGEHAAGKKIMVLSDPKAVLDFLASVRNFGKGPASA